MSKYIVTFYDGDDFVIEAEGFVGAGADSLNFEGGLRFLDSNRNTVGLVAPGWKSVRKCVDDGQSKWDEFFSLLDKGYYDDDNDWDSDKHSNDENDGLVYEQGTFDFDAVPESEPNEQNIVLTQQQYTELLQRAFAPAPEYVSPYPLYYPPYQPWQFTYPYTTC